MSDFVSTTPSKYLDRSKIPPNGDPNSKLAYKHADQIMKGLNMSSNDISPEVKFEQDTRAHVKQVQQNLFTVVKDLLDRAAKHDDSKFLPPERELFVEYTPKLAGLTYGSPEYKQALEGLKPALTHHYAKNDHHSEHYKNGINDMHLIALLELYCDWFAATKRHNDGNIRKSIEINRERYGMSDQLVRIFENTAQWFEAQK